MYKSYEKNTLYYSFGSAFFSGILYSCYVNKSAWLGVLLSCYSKKAAEIKAKRKAKILIAPIMLMPAAGLIGIFAIALCTFNLQFDNQNEVSIVTAYIPMANILNLT